ncbi:MAG: DUF975 family protein [Patescibacteria group bacterium]
MYTLSVKECLTSGWNTFKTRPWIFIGVGVLLLLVNMLISGFQSMLQVGGAYVLGPESTVVAIISAIAGMALTFLVSMGKISFFLKAHDVVSDVSVRTLWHPSPYLKFVGTSILLTVILLIGFILLIVPGIILGIMFGFALYGVIEDGLGPVDALKRSRAITKGNRWRMFLLGLALVGINIVGFIALIVGLLVTLPVSALAVVHAYRVLSREYKEPEIVAAS